MITTRSILYISYNGLLDEILGSQVIPYLRQLSKNGYSFTLLTFEKKDRWDNAGKDQIRKIKNELNEMGIDWHSLRYHKRISLLAKIFDIFSGVIYGVLLFFRKKIKIIHARSIIPAVMALIFKLFKAKFIFDTRGLLAEEYVGGGQWQAGSLYYRIVKFWEKVALKSADEIVVLTQKHREYLLGMQFLKNNKVANKITVIPCCVDTVRFKNDPALRQYLREKEGLGNKFVYMYLGKVATHYMLREMMDFFNVALKENPDILFMILTQSDKRGILSVLDEKKISHDKVIIKKPAFYEIPSLVSMADAGIFFINSYKKFGSSPIKLGEFLSCSVPVIINSGIGDTQELVATNNVGVVVDKFEKPFYKNALTEFMSLIKDAEPLKARCRKVAEGELSLEMGVERYDFIYSRVLKCMK